MHVLHSVKRTQCGGHIILAFGDHALNAIPAVKLRTSRTQKFEFSAFTPQVAVYSPLHGCGYVVNREFGMRFCMLCPTWTRAAP